MLSLNSLAPKTCLKHGDDLRQCDPDQISNNCPWGWDVNKELFHFKLSFSLSLFPASPGLACISLLKLVSLMNLVVPICAKNIVLIVLNSTSSAHFRDTFSNVHLNCCFLPRALANCTSYFSIAVRRNHNQGNLQKKRFQSIMVWSMSSRRQA